MSIKSCLGCFNRPAASPAERRQTDLRSGGRPEPLQDAWQRPAPQNQTSREKDRVINGKRIHRIAPDKEREIRQAVARIVTPKNGLTPTGQEYGEIRPPTPRPVPREVSVSNSHTRDKWVTSSPNGLIPLRI